MERANKAMIARVVARCEKKRRRDISKEASLISGLSLPLCYAAQNTPSVLAARFREAWNPDMYPQKEIAASIGWPQDELGR